jgi:hypothetical protein
MYYLMLVLYLMLTLWQKLGETVTTLHAERIIKKLEKLNENRRKKRSSMK